MIGYEELVDALAAWRSRQGLAETGADFLGPATAFPQYRVAQPATGRAYTEDVEGEVIDDAAEHVVDAAPVEHEHVLDDAAEHVIDAAPVEHEYVAEEFPAAQDPNATVEGEYPVEMIDEDLPAQLPLDDVEDPYAPAAEDSDSYGEQPPAMTYDEPTYADVDAATLAAEDTGGMDAVEEHYEAETMLGEEFPAADDTADAELQVISESDAPEYLEHEETAIGVGVDELAPAEPANLEDDDGEERE